jgi:PQQ-dependent catabolism-associated beta-propeller protein
VEPEGVAVSKDGDTVVNTSETTSMAHFIDWRAKKLVANVLVGARPRYAEFTPDGKQLWVTSEVGGGVSVIDPIKHVVVDKITFAVPGLVKEQIQPVGIRFSKDGKLGFVALGPANRVAVVDAATLKPIKYLLVGQRVWQLELTPDGKTLVSTNGVTNDISVIDVASLKVTKSIAVGSFPWGVAISSQ